MKVIETKNLTKTYRRFKKPEGLKGSLKSLWKREYIEKNIPDKRQYRTLSVISGAGDKGDEVPSLLLCVLFACHAVYRQVSGGGAHRAWGTGSLVCGNAGGDCTYMECLSEEV